MYYKVKEETIQDISNAIKTKSGNIGDIQVKDFAQEILGLETNENTIAAEQSAISAAGSAISAETSAKAASESAGAAAASAAEAIEETTIIAATAAQSANDAEVSASASESSAIASNESAESAKLSSFNSEAWSSGTRNGIDVSPDDITYHNNSKYWYEQAFNVVNIEVISEEEIQTLWDNVFNQGGA